MTTEMMIKKLDSALTERGFIRRPSDAVMACWVRKKLNTNRAVVMLRCPEDADPAVFARDARRRCASAAGFYIPVFYGIGLQVVVVGPPAQTPPEKVVDTYDNQWCVLQAIHVVDEASGLVETGGTWGQVISGADQRAVAFALGSELEGAPPAHVARKPTPPIVAYLPYLGLLVVGLWLLRILFE